MFFDGLKIALLISSLVTISCPLTPEALPSPVEAFASCMLI